VRSTTALRGKVVVITGAARGLGAGLAREAARRGATVALLGLEPDELARQAARCGPSAQWWEVDITDAAALARTAHAVADRFGRVDVLVSNAGIAAGGPLLVADPHAYERVIEVNLLGSVRTARAFLPFLLESRGYLLQVASLAAMLPAPLMSSYCASKSGVEAFAHCLRGETVHHGMKVGVAYLSWTDTDMVRGADAVPALAHLRQRLPWPFNLTFPVERIVADLADGLVRRSAHVYAPGWLRVLVPSRGFLAETTLALTKVGTKTAELDMTAAGPGATGLVGAGGAADAAHQLATHEPGPLQRA
jgi:NAD(P)-dependent dehydrogenase (short-subunit alcohol dehydrogenase family)